MKIKGQTISVRDFKVVIPILRGENSIYLQAAMVNVDDFDAIYPQPIPDTIMRPGGVATKDLKKPAYVEAVTKRDNAFSNYMIIKSLLAGTEDLEFETINLKDPNTFQNIWKELQESISLSVKEQALIINAVLEVHGLDDAKVEAARKSFLSSGQSVPEA